MLKLVLSQNYFCVHSRIVGRKDIDGDSVNGNVTDTDQYPIVEVYLSGHRSNFVKAQVSTSV